MRLCQQVLLLALRSAISQNVGNMALVMMDVQVDIAEMLIDSDNAAEIVNGINDLKQDAGLWKKSILTKQNHPENHISFFDSQIQDKSGLNSSSPTCRHVITETGVCIGENESEKSNITCYVDDTSSKSSKVECATAYEASIKSTSIPQESKKLRLKTWPPHCTTADGRKFYPGFTKGTSEIIERGSDINVEEHSAVLPIFDGGTLRDRYPSSVLLSALDEYDVVLVGFGLEYAIKYTALDLKQKKHNVFIIEDLAGRQETSDDVKKDLEKNGIKFVTVEQFMCRVRGEGSCKKTNKENDTQNSTNPPWTAIILTACLSAGVLSWFIFCLMYSASIKQKFLPAKALPPSIAQGGPEAADERSTHISRSQISERRPKPDTIPISNVFASHGNAGHRPRRSNPHSNVFASHAGHRRAHSPRHENVNRSQAGYDTSPRGDDGKSQRKRNLEGVNPRRKVRGYDASNADPNSDSPRGRKVVNPSSRPNKFGIGDAAVRYPKKRENDTNEQNLHGGNARNNRAQRTQKARRTSTESLAGFLHSKDGDKDNIVCSAFDTRKLKSLEDLLVSIAPKQNQWKDDRPTRPEVGRSRRPARADHADPPTRPEVGRSRRPVRTGNTAVMGPKGKHLAPLLSGACPSARRPDRDRAPKGRR